MLRYNKINMYNTYKQEKSKTIEPDIIQTLFTNAKGKFANPLEWKAHNISSHLVCKT